MLSLNKQSIKQFEQVYIQIFFEILSNQKKLNDCYSSRYRQFVDVAMYCTRCFDTAGQALYEANQPRKNSFCHGHFSNLCDRDFLILEMIHFKIIRYLEENLKNLILTIPANANPNKLKKAWLLMLPRENVQELRALQSINAIKDMLLTCAKPILENYILIDIFSALKLDSDAPLFYLDKHSGFCANKELFHFWIKLAKHNPFELSSLTIGELALGLGALFGLLAFLALLLLPWAVVIVATTASIMALSTAVVGLTIFPAHKKVIAKAKKNCSWLNLQG